MTLEDVQKLYKEEKKQKRRWEYGFQRWCDKMSEVETSSYGKCGYGYCCDYCTCSGEKNQCIKAFRKMVKETGRIFVYEKQEYEDAWNGISTIPF